VTLSKDEILRDPGRIDLFGLLRVLERGATDKPRIGRAQVLAQEIVRLEQDPFLAHPVSNIQSVEFPPFGPPEVHAAFLGYFGPQGALPLMVTDEVMHWVMGRDDSFVRFANIFATRFLQLFFRAWADARPIAHADRPHDDRFALWVGATIGIGTPATRDRDRIADRRKIGLAGVLGARVKSASRLEQVIRGILGVEVRLFERAGLWLEFEPGDRTRLGQTGATLGRNSHAGARVYSINDKAVLEIRTGSLERYQDFLPGGAGFARLADLVRFHAGDLIEFDVALALPSSIRPPVRLGRSGALGWTAWVAPPPLRPGAADEYVADATFRLTRAESVR
jgi:type VI secretion system protein ImpH